MGRKHTHTHIPYMKIDFGNVLDFQIKVAFITVVLFGVLCYSLKYIPVQIADVLACTADVISTIITTV